MVRLSSLPSIAAALVAAGALAVSTPAASADTGPAAALAEAKAQAEAQTGKRDCFVGNINNGDKWTAYAQNPTHPGQATWYEHGDRLKIVDSLSDGNRTIGSIRWCSGGDWSKWHNYDSGPDEGNIDVRWKNFDLKEGRKVQILACRDNGGDGDRCGKTVSANA
ncbi:hypothetical protein [Streptomyces cavernicola]|uniref:Ricin B lectin domain-containing protein n=1 Tax=Streptomyces cavernicola TaxID=3043613 RepID=A0ABT6SA39_9ACTN|nr:hypothetical protein [Streptomyces sp. B-S-A6]MDI3404186.1 hypothetical protein [Streptomyces sp. B-S-A6]